ncbi:MAG: HAD-IIB family hydrolase [Candidatus Nomurabacteria bacterium]|jgi:HAD superfamily hydrolase (TIGR01484 family)|nr:HAD-IIB family hydrolase [Candidatus Nomurabacteria bacterium]
MKKVIAFDQDDTLNVTKIPMPPEMAELVKRLLDKYEVCIISGTNWEVMGKNNIEALKDVDTTQEQFKRLHIMPTTGTQYWHYVDGEWKCEYAHFLTDEQATKITVALERASKKLGYWCENPAGEIIENRGSQITMSALGQWATPEDKHAWDPTKEKRKAIVDEVTPELESLGVEVHSGGSTSVDVTLPGIDKAYGMRKFMEQTGYTMEEILFIGDRLQEGGNDYPVRAMGIDWIEVTRWEDTAYVLRGILGVTE